jgi:hypothetical protein
MNAVGRAQKPNDVGDEHQNGGKTERMRPHRRHKLPARKIRNRVAKSTPRAKRQTERIERTEANQMRSVRIHHRHGRETHNPYGGFEHAPPPPPVQATTAPPEINAPYSG